MFGFWHETFAWHFRLHTKLCWSCCSATKIVILFVNGTLVSLSLTAHFIIRICMRIDHNVKNCDRYVVTRKMFLFQSKSKSKSKPTYQLRAHTHTLIHITTKSQNLICGPNQLSKSFRTIAFAFFFSSASWLFAFFLLLFSSADRFGQVLEVVFISRFLDLLKLKWYTVPWINNLEINKIILLCALINGTFLKIHKCTIRTRTHEST